MPFFYGGLFGDGKYGKIGYLSNEGFALVQVLLFILS